MAQIYDTQEIRRAARTIRSSLDRVTGTARPKVQSIEKSIDGEFEGAAAEALKQKLSQLDADVATIASALNTLNKTLLRFADALDEADARIQRSL